MKRLSSDISEVGIDLDAPLIKDLGLLEFLNKCVDSPVSIIRIVQLVVLKLLHLGFVLSELFA